MRKRQGKNRTKRPFQPTQLEFPGMQLRQKDTLKALNKALLYNLQRENHASTNA